MPAPRRRRPRPLGRARHLRRGVAPGARARIWKAVVPASGDKGGKIGVISTAERHVDEKTGDGNFFHHLWSNAGKVDYPKLKKKFLGWWLHPDRDEEWYDNVGLDDDKAEQYPNDPEEAFLMSGSRTSTSRR
jgi:hypothetical protein